MNRLQSLRTAIILPVTIMAGMKWYCLAKFISRQALPHSIQAFGVAEVHEHKMT